MALFERHELQQNGAETNIILYLNQNQTEFAKEPGQTNANERLTGSVQEYVRERFPNKRFKTAKIMLGTMLIASVPLAGTEALDGADLVGRRHGHLDAGEGGGVGAAAAVDFARILGGSAGRCDVDVVNGGDTLRRSDGSRRQEVARTRPGAAGDHENQDKQRGPRPRPRLPDRILRLPHSHATRMS